MAIGLRAHSGWAAAVALEETGDLPAVIGRRRIELADAAIPGAKQPYHAAEPLPFAEAEEFLNRSVASSRQMAREGLASLVRELGPCELAGCGVLLGSGRALPALANVLASHALIHAAEGEMYRDVLVHSAGQIGLRVTGIREKEILERASPLAARLTELGKAIGPPWTQDQKLATLAAWIALKAASR